VLLKSKFSTARFDYYGDKLKCSERMVLAALTSWKIVWSTRVRHAAKSGAEKANNYFLHFLSTCTVQKLNHTFIRFYGRILAFNTYYDSRGHFTTFIFYFLFFAHSALLTSRLRICFFSS